MPVNVPCVENTGDPCEDGETDVNEEVCWEWGYEYGDMPPIDWTYRHHILQLQTGMGKQAGQK